MALLRQRQAKKIKSNKTKLISLSVLLCLTLVFTFLIVKEIYGRISQPAFDVLKQNQEKVMAYKQANPDLFAPPVDTRAIDTDEDGLSDYVENNVYKTSPYLEDTDSDGVSDFDEVQNETNPKCHPQDYYCSVSQEEIVVKADDFTIDDFLTGQVDVITFKKILISSGISESDLAQLDNETIAAIYQRVISQPMENTTPDKAFTVENMENIINDVMYEKQLKDDNENKANKVEKILDGELDTYKLRKFLVNSGFDEKLLNNIGNDQLREIYLKTNEKIKKDQTTLNADEIKEVKLYLQEAGISQDYIDSLSDEEVQKLYRDTLADQN